MANETEEKAWHSKRFNVEEDSMTNEITFPRLRARDLEPATGRIRKQVEAEYDELNSIPTLHRSTPYNQIDDSYVIK